MQAVARRVAFMLLRLWKLDTPQVVLSVNQQSLMDATFLQRLNELAQHARMFALRISSFQ